MEPTEYFALHANMHGQDHSLTEVNKVSLLDPSLPLSGKQKEQTRGRMILRLKIYSLIDGGRANCNNGSLGVCKTLTNVYLLQPSKGLGRRRLHLRVRRSALKDEKNGGGNNGGSLGKNWDPGLEIEVPFEQRPVNEYSSLKDGVLYSWAELSPGLFFLRLGGLWLVAFAVLGAPVSSASFDPSRETLKFLLAAGTGPLFLVSLVVLRIYLGWSYVGDRLLSAVIPYEESGWYDGQMWVKPPEVLARDRLLGSYKVKPVIKMLKQTLLSTGALLVTLVSLFIFADQVQDLVHASVMINGDSSSVSNPKNSFRREELLSLPVEVINDDDLAAAAAEAADGRPVYCRDRFYRALAGGQYCKWEDLLK